MCPYSVKALGNTLVFPAAIFGSKQRAAMMMLGDSAMIAGRKLKRWRMKHGY